MGIYCLFAASRTILPDTGDEAVLDNCRVLVPVAAILALAPAERAPSRMVLSFSSEEKGTSRTRQL